MKKKIFKVKTQNSGVSIDDFFDIIPDDVDPVEDTYPHLKQWYFEPKVSLRKKTITALDYIFEKQGYCINNIIYRFNEKEQIFDVSFIGVESINSGPVASLIKSICHLAEKYRFTKIRGVKTLECTIKINKLGYVVFNPGNSVFNGVLIQSVLESLNYLDSNHFIGSNRDLLLVYFMIEGQILRMGFTDTNGNVIERLDGSDFNLSEQFLLLSAEDIGMAEYLKSLNSTYPEDRLITNLRYILEFEGQRRFGCYKSDWLQDERERDFEEMPWVKTRIRTKILEAILDI